MADIKHITIEGGTYDICDETARSDIETLQTNVDTLTSLVSEGTIIISDSFGTGYSPDGTTVPFPEIFRNRSGIANFYTNSFGGAGFKAESDDGKNFLVLLQQLDSVITNKNAIKNIFVVGGVNDNKSTIVYDEIITNMNQFLTYAMTNYPNATIGVGAVGTWSPFQSAENRLRFINKSLKAYQQSSSHTRTYYLSGIENVLKDNSLISTDGVHPNQDGQRALANFLYSHVNGSKYNVNNYNNYGTDGLIHLTHYGLVSSYSVTNGSYIGIGKQVNGDFTTYLVEIPVVFNTAVSTGTANRLKLSMLNSIKQDSPVAYNQCSLTQFAPAIDIEVPIIADNTSRIVNAKLEVIRDSSDNLYYLALRFNEAISNITQINLIRTQFEIPTLIG